MKQIIKIIAIVILLGIVVFACLIIYATTTKYKPAEKEVLFTSQPEVLPDSLEFSVMIWNIGYCGLGKEMDFFYDGGEHTRATSENTYINLLNIKHKIQSNDTCQFLMIQEIDSNSYRSYYFNELDTFAKNMTKHQYFFGKNYDVKFVPVPITSPMGKVVSGLTTFSKFTPSESARYSFSSKYAWPKNLFMLDRCFLVNRYPLSNGKELLIINTHNSAYDPGDKLKKVEMDYFKTFVTGEFEKGNYIIVGGDWNQSPFDCRQQFGNFDSTDFSEVSKDYLPDTWHWVYDNKTPSNRRVKTAYDAQTTKVTLIDFYLTSPNVETMGVKTENLNFENSDHQPVVARFKLKIKN